MFAPGVPTRIEEGNFCSRIRVYNHGSVGLPAITVETRQGQILRGIRSTLGERDYMVYREAHILPLF